MKKIKGTPDAWENGDLGREEEFVRVSTTVSEDALDAAAELHPISIRLQKSLIEDFKMIADIHGIGYQPLIRQVLKRFSDAEKKRILREKYAEMGSPHGGENAEDHSPEHDCSAFG